MIDFVVFFQFARNYLDFDYVFVDLYSNFYIHDRIRFDEMNSIRIYDVVQLMFPMHYHRCLNNYNEEYPLVFD